ncbi:MAG: hypothetical protein M0Z51_07025 [Propionibacterium sp.]|nr:hypothetical protein [Propionibacterium sp.]
MSLASLIREQMAPVVRCKTCTTLDRLTEDDRVEFVSAVKAKVPGSILARAVTARLAELSIDEALSETAVRAHIRDGHGL